MDKILVLRSTEMTDRSFCPIFFPFLLKGDILKARLSSARKEPGSLNRGAFREDGFHAPSGEQQGAGEALRLRGRVGSGRRRQGTSQTLAHGPVLGAQSHGRKGQRTGGQDEGGRERLSVLCLREKKECDQNLEKLKNHTYWGGEHVSQRSGLEPYNV